MKTTSGGTKLDMGCQLVTFDFKDKYQMMNTFMKGEVAGEHSGYHFWQTASCWTSVWIFCQLETLLINCRRADNRSLSKPPSLWYALGDSFQVQAVRFRLTFVDQQRPELVGERTS